MNRKARRQARREAAMTSWTPSFTPTSWWNTPIPADVPVAVNSDLMITAQASHCAPPTLSSPTGSWAMPWSEVGPAQGTLVTVLDKKDQTVSIYVDLKTADMAGNDAAVVWRDRRSGVEVSTFETVISRKADGTIDPTKPIRCTSFGRYQIAGSGIASQSGGEALNTGHRGIPPSAMALHPLDTAIHHRLKTSLAPPADHPGPTWPMYGIESPRAGGIPEGAVIRLKTYDPSNAMQTSCHDFGLIVGDTGGHASVKTVLGGAYPDAVLHALNGFTWGDWEVMTLGWRP